MKDIPAIKGRYYIARLVEEGEHERQDFKFAISDARKIARSVSAFANNDGGRLLIGVKDDGVVAGIRSEEEIYMIETAAGSFCDPPVKVEVTAFKVEPGVVVLRAEIPRSLRPPVFVIEEGGARRAYYRVKDENIVAPELLLKTWRYYASGDGAFMRMTGAHNSLLAFIREKGRVTLDECVLASHLPTDSVTDIVARLAAASVVNIVHDGNGFVITL